ncbi:MAG: hypothetical protein K2I72_02060 [Bacilli bacterium]|nr:hypothetical protein [Bacilli bacterium]
MEYITNILTDTVHVEGTIEFISDRVKGYQEPMCVIVISVPQKNFLRPINSKIPSVHSITFYTQILQDITENVLYSDNLWAGRFYSVKGTMNPSFQGLDTGSHSGNRLKISFSNIGTELSEAIDEYNEKFDAYKKTQEESKEVEDNSKKGKVK